MDCREAEQDIEDILTTILEPLGYQVALAALPEKLLVVRSARGVYGRNSIATSPAWEAFTGPWHPIPTSRASKTTGATPGC